jgi:hypothetical protein
MFQGWRGADDTPASQQEEKRYEFLIVMMTATEPLAGACGGRQQAGELKRQTQSVDVQERRFRIFTQVPGRGFSEVAPSSLPSLQ